MESYCMAMSMEVSYSVSQSVQIYFNEVDLNSYNEQLINYLSRFLKSEVICFSMVFRLSFLYLVASGGRNRYFRLCTGCINWHHLPTFGFYLFRQDQLRKLFWGPWPPPAPMDIRPWVFYRVDIIVPGTEEMEACVLVLTNELWLLSIYIYELLYC